MRNKQVENTHPLENDGKGNRCTGPTTTTLTTCELIQNKPNDKLSKTWTGLYVRTLYCTHSANRNVQRHNTYWSNRRT